MISVRSAEGNLGEFASATAFNAVATYCRERNLPNINRFFQQGWTHATVHTAQEIAELVKFDSSMPSAIKDVLKDLAKILLRAGEVAILN